MDNLTHTLIGATLAKAGLERLSPYATTVCVVAANAPDVDVLTRFGGPWFALEHHRGITHSITGTLTLGLLLPLFVFLIAKISARLFTAQPRIRLRGLIVASLVACATHPLLDWLNSYGIRPLLPWNRRWFYGDILYIFDPWLWLMLGGAAFLLTARTRWRTLAWGVLGFVLTATLLSQRVLPPFPVAARVVWLAGLALIIWARHVRLAERAGARMAWGVLGLVVCYCCVLAFVHAQALARAHATSATLAAEQGETLQRVAAMPTFADPTRWLTIAETERATYRFETRLGSPSASATAQPLRFAKPAGEAAVQVTRAAQDWRAGVFLRFARFPVISLQAADGGDTLVRFADLRFTVPGQTRTRAGFSLDVRVPAQ
jgi:inner membrane protein